MGLDGIMGWLSYVVGILSALSVLINDKRSFSRQHCLEKAWIDGLLLGFCALILTVQLSMDISIASPKLSKVDKSDQRLTLDSVCTPCNVFVTKVN